MIDIEIIKAALPQLMRGAGVSLQISFLACLFGLALGVVIAFLQTSKYRLLRITAHVYVTIIRGTPMLLQIMAFFFIFPAIGIYLSAFWSAIITISINSGAYVSQVIRSGILSVGKGQREAAKVLGLTPYQTERYIVLPQALRVVLPALGNELITLIKDSSLASVIGVQELTYEGGVIKNMTYDVITAFVAVGCIYLVITTALSFIVTSAERKMSLHVKD